MTSVFGPVVVLSVITGFCLVSQADALLLMQNVHGFRVGQPPPAVVRPLYRTLQASLRLGGLCFIAFSIWFASRTAWWASLIVLGSGLFLPAVVAKTFQLSWGSAGLRGMFGFAWPLLLALMIALTI